MNVVTMVNNSSLKQIIGVKVSDLHPLGNLSLQFKPAYHKVVDSSFLSFKSNKKIGIN